MAHPNEVEMPSYIVYRDAAPGQPFDPTIPLAFFPPKGSDELFDALRAKYPHLKSHSERVREAVIEFLVEESQLDQPQVHQMSVPQMAQLTTRITSYCPAMFPSAASDTSTWSSPETLSLATSSFEDSPQTQPRSRQFSTPTPGTEPSEPSPPALEQMTGVFSLSDSNQPKQRIRRKMTEQEKVEYRKRRIIKACEICSKRKRKCNHNQQEMETVASKSRKIPRSSGASTSKKKPPDPSLLKIPGSDENPTPNPMEFDDPFRCELMQPFDDFGNLLEAPLPDLTFDDLLAPSQVQWPWTDTPDFILMDSSGDSFATRPQSELTGGHDLSPRQPLLFSESEPMHDYDMSQFMDGNLQHSSMLWEHLRTGQQSVKPQPTHTPHVHGTEGDEAFVFDGGVKRFKYAHYHDWKRDDIYDSQRSMTERRIEGTEMAQVTLRLTGTARAMRAFGRLLSQHSAARARLMSPSAGRVAAVVLESLQNDGIRRGAIQPVVFQDGAPMRSNVHGFGDGRRTTHSLAVQGRENNAASQVTHEQETDVSPDTDSTNAANHLHMNTGPSNFNTACQRSHNIHKHLDRAKRMTKAIDASPMIAASPKERNLQDQRHPSAPRSPQSLSLGELGDSILANTSPSTELFMLRRRIPKALHNIVNHSNAGNTSDSMIFQQTVSPLHTQPQRLEERGTVFAYNAEHTDVNSNQVNGSALRQLDSAFHSNSGVAMSPVLSAANQLLHNRPHLPTAFSYVGQADVYQDRLSDHVRRRDHFGRHLDTGLQVLGAVAGLGWLLMLLSLLPTHTSNLSLLLLALASPVRGAKGTHIPRRSTVRSEVWGTLLQAITKSSVWWADVDIQGSDRLHEWEGTSSSTWSKETGKVSYGSLWPQWCWKKECARVGA